MKKVLYIGFLATFICLLFSSCLKKDLPDYPEFENAEISLVSAEHRFEGSTTMWDKPVVVYRKLDVSQNIDSKNGIINIDISVPAPSGQFTAAEKAKVSPSKIWFYFTISTAARIAAIDGTPALGEPTDASKPLKFVVTSAAGTTKNWIVNVNSFINN